MKGYIILHGQRTKYFDVYSSQTEISCNPNKNPSVLFKKKKKEIDEIILKSH